MSTPFEHSRVTGFLHADGTVMKNGNGEEVLLRGWGMGNWNNPEGFMLGGVSDFNIAPDGSIQHMGRLDRGRSMEQVVRETCGSAYAEEFWKKWHRAYLGEADIRHLSELGYNSVRLPIRACCFLREEPGIQFNEDSFSMLEDIFSWCEQYRVYAILDLHAAVGGQSSLPCDDGIDNVPRLFLDEESRERTLILCEEFARRYHDRWILGAYNYINEPLSIPTWSYLDAKLRDFYLELVRRVRVLDKNHLFLLEGTHFSSRVSIFDCNFDPECNNWGISIHCYGSRPEVPVFSLALKKREELNIPLWMGETGGPDEWMASLYELLLEYHIGFNIWCWKIAEGSDAAHAMSFTLPDEWQLIVDYAVHGGGKPSYEHAQKIWNQYLENVRAEHCGQNPATHSHVLRHGRFSVPAVCYDALPGTHCGHTETGGVGKYRLADCMDIVFAPGYETKETIFGAPRPDTDWQNMQLHLHEGDSAGYTVRDTAGGGQVVLHYHGAEQCRIQVRLGDAPAEEQALPPDGVLTLSGLPAAAELRVQVTVLSGSVVLEKISFD